MVSMIRLHLCSSADMVPLATSNDPWGPTGTEMSEISQMTFNGYQATNNGSFKSANLRQLERLLRDHGHA